MLGWSHRLKFWTILANQLLAVLVFALMILCVVQGAELSWPMIVYVGTVLVMSPFVTASRGY